MMYLKQITEVKVHIAKMDGNGAIYWKCPRCSEWNWNKRWTIKSENVYDCPECNKPCLKPEEK